MSGGAMSIKLQAVITGGIPRAPKAKNRAELEFYF